MVVVLCVSIGLCLLLYFLFVSSVSFLLSLNFLSMVGCYWLVNFDFDVIAFGVVVMLLVCFMYVYFYTGHYFGGSSVGFMLLKLIILFVGIMGVLVCTGDYLCTLIFWEYLGVVSFFLILYYDSFLSLRSSVITLVSSRFGDVCLFLLIGLSCCVGVGGLFLLMCFFLVVFSKSAGYPFVSWLLEAMRAPTPVSSLVHSSTLVAAGVWFVMRYDCLLYFSDWLMIFFSVMLVLTILITGVSSFFFFDLKKIVALSTCNNISWCVLYLVFGDVMLSLFQLISHGVSKCILFMLVGDVMSGSGGSQSSNCVYSSSLYGSWNLFGLFSVILGLSGVPFIGVFFTKHFLLGCFVNVVNVVVCLIVMVCVFLSYTYSFRLCGILCSVSNSISSGVLFYFGSGLMVYCWLFINFYLFLLLNESNFVGVFYSLCLIVIQLVALLIFVMCGGSSVLGRWSSSLFGCDNLVELSYNLFYSFLYMISFFFLRWDYLMMVLFYGVGRVSSVIYSWVMLNIFMFGVFGLFICILVV
uniref:NADH:ubiquinone reductase (H(+)-translocating) n=1 Tax=Echinococcus oligarthrus TaxID=6212 RepID=A4PBB7_ECHOL|nr:NADH dehydrogenase subunit 5 [Echinococcus oligarthrus]BAF56509.1 NADH dehydrogenase subunit 5 [Echinococcus oligarthrus]